MNHTKIFHILFTCLAVPYINAQIASEVHIDLNSVLQKSIDPTYLKDLEELGYCVIPEVLSSLESDQLYKRVWYEFIEKAWPDCKLENRSNWKESFPMHNKFGVFTGPAGQIQAMWDLRQDIRIVNVFAQIWNTNDLIVSMDGISVMCPPEIREGNYEPWPHVDQTILRRLDNVAHSNNPPIDFVSESLLNTNPYTIQGQFLFEDSFNGDGGFYCIPKSHLKFNEFGPQLDALEEHELSRDEKRKARNEIFHTFFGSGLDGTIPSSNLKHVTAPRGSLILWDSRTIHWNQHALQTRPYSDNPKVRMVGYLCYVPKARLAEEGKILRIEALKTGVSTGHNPTNPELKRTIDHLRPGYEKYLEDPGYTQPIIQLTPLGESLLF